jgi:urease accessory protein
MRRSLPVGLLAAAGLATPAFAHTGVDGAGGLVTGLLHPLLGLDHLLAMVAVGLWAAVAAGRQLWALPLAFVAAMVVGGALGAAGLPLPGMELWIVASVVVLGAVVAFAVNTPTAIAVGTVALFALAHGVAHGAEMPATAHGVLYGAGFVGATAALHATGVALGLALARLRLDMLTRLGGGAIAATGLLFVVFG